MIAATSVTDMDLAALKRRPVSIYLAPSITDVTLLKPLLTLFVQQTMDILTRNMQETKIPVYFLLDEFRQRHLAAWRNGVHGHKVTLAHSVVAWKHLPPYVFAEGRAVAVKLRAALRTPGSAEGKTC